MVSSNTVSPLHKSLIPWTLSFATSCNVLAKLPRTNSALSSWPHFGFIQRSFVDLTLISYSPCSSLYSDAQQKAATAGAAIELDDLEVEEDSSADQLMLGTFLSLELIFGRLASLFTLWLLQHRCRKSEYSRLEAIKALPFLSS